MRSIPLIFIGFIPLSFVSPVAAEAFKPETREALKTAIPEGIRLLETKEHEAFLKAFVPPADLKKITEETSLERFAKTFGERKASRLLEVLQEIKDAKPSLDDTGTNATFTLKEELGGKKSITFVKIEKYWYIVN